MHYDTTNELINTISAYIDTEKIVISTEKQKNFNGEAYRTDYVTIDEASGVGFEVFENEIIIFYFTDHTHFEDYSSEICEGDDDYIKRAKVFLVEFLTQKVRHTIYYRRNKMYLEKYFMVYSDGREDEFIGGTWYSIWRSVLPFPKSTTSSETWQYDKSKGRFTTRSPKSPDTNAIEIIDINADCYVEIFKNDNAYTYQIMKIDYDEYYGRYLWVPANMSASGFYDTKEKAIQEAFALIK